MKRLMTFALLAAFALPVATTPMFGKDTTKKQKKKKGKAPKAPKAPK
jgi:hypothetical protein